MIEVTERINHLMDFYAPLLTEKQNQVLEYYFREDYSLSEIAELMEVSRSAVHDLLKRCEATLESYEDKLHLYEKFQNRHYKLNFTVKGVNEDRIAYFVAKSTSGGLECAVILDENNIHEDSEYFYLTQLAAKCTAKRMVPDYISAKVMRELKEGNVYSSINKTCA